MVDPAQEHARSAAPGSLPRIVFVLGKGGVGRSTVATALALARAARGERVLILEWAVTDPISPWFGKPSAGTEPREIDPGVSVANFSLDEALRAYFVDHLQLQFVYRHIIHAKQVQHMLEVAPGLSELLFLGQLWWLITLAPEEAGLEFDRIVVDAPATGHALSMLDVPATLTRMGAAGLLDAELRRVVDLLADPVRLGALVVALPEPLVADETHELVPRLTERLGRPPLAVVINRSAAAIASAEPRPAWLGTLGARLSPDARRALELTHDELRARLAVEVALRRDRTLPTVALAELPGRAPGAVVRELAPTLGAAW